MIRWLRYTWVGVVNTKRLQWLILVMLLLAGINAGGLFGFIVQAIFVVPMFLIGAHANGRWLVNRATRRLTGDMSRPSSKHNELIK